MVFAIPNHWESRKLWVQRDPRAPKELIEHVVGLSISVWESTAHNVHAEAFMELVGCHGQVFQVFGELELGEMHSLLEVSVGEHAAFTRATVRVGPSEDG